MTITISNADNALIKIIKDLNAFRQDAPYKIKKQKPNKAESLKAEVKKVKEDYLAGKIKGYHSAKEMHEAIFNEK